MARGERSHPSVLTWDLGLWAKLNSGGECFVDGFGHWLNDLALVSYHDDCGPDELRPRDLGLAEYGPRCGCFGGDGHGRGIALDAA